MKLFRESATPPGTWLFILECRLRWAPNRLAKIDGALIWRRPKRGAAVKVEAAEAA
jgi:hypothetical protein